MEITLLVLSTAVSLAAIFLAIKLVQSKKAYDAFRNKYKGISDRDAEIRRREAAIADLSNKQVSLEQEHAKRLTELNQEYSKYKTIYDTLRTELASVEENLDIQSFGVYKPHFDFKSSEEYKANLERNYERQKALVKDDLAARCSTQWFVGGSRQEGQKMTKHYTKLMLRAFNGESDAAILKVKWNNILVMEQRIGKTFEAINKLGTTHNISITQEYLDVKIKELHLTHELEDQLYKEKEEQRRVQEQMREEEKVQREIERAKKEAEDEEQRYQKALEKARIELQEAKGVELDDLNKKIMDLEIQLKHASEEKERAISRAQLTKSGHVYIISNIGSLGENVFKIGMTRRLEPLDRVRELGDASVPFAFDVHAMVYSENAPELEGKLHDFFQGKRINLVNERKEFFNVSISELEEFARASNLSLTITHLAEAKEYRESLALRQQNLEQPSPPPEANPLPSTLIEAS